MKINIGSKYEETKSDLMKKIREETISVLEAEAIGHACYFCLKSIEGKMRILVDKYEVGGKEAESKYFIDNVCYQESKLHNN